MPGAAPTHFNRKSSAPPSGFDGRRNRAREREKDALKKRADPTYAGKISPGAPWAVGVRPLGRAKNKRALQRSSERT
jgi:hypothetical protein